MKEEFPMIEDCKSGEDFDRILLNSKDRPVFLFKHSTACRVSAAAWERFKKFAQEEGGSEFWRVLVIEDREISSQIAQRTGIVHQSPQVILFYGGAAVWSASHESIDESAMRAGLDLIKPHTTSAT
ncbi:MAG: bacillithiol system redox-active protein YtxJ [bacterium]